MPVNILHAATRAAYSAAASQVEQCEAVRNAFTGNVTLRIEGAGGQHLRTMTLAPFTVNTATPRGIVCGAVLADTAVAPAAPGAAGIAPVRWEFRDGSTPIFDTDEITQGPIRTLCQPRFGSVVFTANPLLPLNEVIAWSTASSDPGTLVSGVWTPGRDSRGVVTQASVNTLPLNAWVRVSGLSMQAIRNLIESTGFLFASHDWSNGKNVRSIFNAWVGCADDGRRVWYPRGGGHEDSSLNAVVALDLLKMGWELPQPPSRPDVPGIEWAASYDIPPNATFTNYNLSGSFSLWNDTDGLYRDRLPDGRPTSAHTYHGVWYDSTRRQIGTGRVSKWTYDISGNTWTRQRWTFHGAAPEIFTINQELHYHAGRDALYGYPARGDFDTGNFGKVVMPGANFVSLAGAPNFALGNGGIGTSVRLDENRILFLWMHSGERWGIYNMATEAWDSGSGGLITGGQTFGSTNEMQIALYVPTWGAQGQVIRRGTASPINGNWWLFDIATKANQSYTPVGATIPVTSWPGNKWRSMPGLGIAIGMDDNNSTALGEPAIYVMRFA